ncbi:MAG: hypothetical protein JNM07_05455 [Phycisphaerae bacterium]|nr:hypothetical protein [Phycisphaerae bacterium]
MSEPPAPLNSAPASAGGGGARDGSSVGPGEPSAGPNDSLLRARVSSGPSTRSRSGTLGRDLTGDLPCVGCGYNLRGLSVVGACPECGIAVTATVLAVVDPQAEELRPIRAPGLVAAGLMVCAMGALAAGLLMWAPRVMEAGSMVLGRPTPLIALPLAEMTAACLALSALGAAAWSRPHHATPAWHVASGLGGAAALVALAWVSYGIHEHGMGTGHWGIAASWEGLWPTIRPRLVSDACVAATLIGLRPNARVLVQHSMAMRMGRVDRQTMLAMLAAVGVVVLGRLCGLIGAGWLRVGSVELDVVRGISMTLVAVGSALLTLGLGSATLDCARIAAVVRRPAPSMRDIVGVTGGEKPGKAGSGGRP